MLTLVPFSTEDFQQLIEWIPDSSFLLQWGGPAFTYPLTVVQLEDYVSGANTEMSSTYIFKAIDTSSGEVIGHISIGRVDRSDQTTRIGKVLIGPSEQRGHGYGKQLMQAALRFAFEELTLQKVTLGVFTFNTPAIRCYEKLGFIQERMLKKCAKTWGGLLGFNRDGCRRKGRSILRVKTRCSRK